MGDPPWLGPWFSGLGVLTVALLPGLTPLCLVPSLPLPKHSLDSAVVVGALLPITGSSSAPGHRGLEAQPPWRLCGGALSHPPSPGPHVPSALPLTPLLFSCLQDLTKENRVSGPQPGPSTFRGPLSPLASQTLGPPPRPQRRKPLLITLPRMQADESSQVGAGREVGLAGMKLSRPEDRTPSRQPRLCFIAHFLPNKGPAHPGSSHCCSVEISRWFPINHSLWCLGGQKESNKTSFLSRKSFAES